MAVPRKTMQ